MPVLPYERNSKGASVGKLMTSVFWDCVGVFKPLIGSIMPQSCVTQKINQVKTPSSRKLRAGVWRLQDNVPVHTAQVAIAEAYSPGLVPSGFYLFPKMKSYLQCRRFESDNSVIYAVGAQTADFFREGIAKRGHRWSKYIEVQGDYVEK